jgi:uncharacterized damage-inducible protein DinB
MTTAEQLKHDLETILWGEAWYGPNIYKTIDAVSFEAAFEKPLGSVHTIAGILLHMLSWTEEVMDRMNGMEAQLPSSGDWPDTGTPDEQKWQRYVNDLKLVTVNLLGVIQNFPDYQWDDLINDNRENKPKVTYKGLIQGFIQHQVYHAGQIALLTRIIIG